MYEHVLRKHPSFKITPKKTLNLNSMNRYIIQYFIMWIYNTLSYGQLQSSLRILITLHSD